MRRNRAKVLLMWKRNNRESVLLMDREEQDAFEGKERALVFVMGERNRMFLKGRKGQYTCSACCGREEQDVFKGKERAIYM